NDMIAAGYMPQAVDGYTPGGSENFISIWANTPGAPFIARHGMTSAQYQTEFTTQLGLGYRVASLSAYQVGGTTYFAAYWVKDGITDYIGNHDWSPGGLFTNAVNYANGD